MAKCKKQQDIALTASGDCCKCNGLDIISRRSAIDAMLSEFKRVPTIAIRAKDVLEKLPSAEAEQQWIPSGEKPPEKGNYLVWMPFALPEHRITVAEYCGGYWNIKTPISAWMPLSEPYAERKTDE